MEIGRLVCVCVYVWVCGCLVVACVVTSQPPAAKEGDQEGRGHIFKYLYAWCKCGVYR